MGVLDSLSGVVGNLLTTFGQSVTFTTYAETYSPATGSNTLVATNTTARALVEDYPAGLVDVGGIARGDKQVTVAASAFTPTTEATVTIGGTIHAIVKVDTQYGTDDALLYVCQARR